MLLCHTLFCCRKVKVRCHDVPLFCVALRAVLHLYARARSIARAYMVQVAVTARYARAEANTLGWLRAQGLLTIPVIHAAGIHPSDDTRAEFKAAAIRSLKKSGWRPVRPAAIFFFACV